MPSPEILDKILIIEIIANMYWKKFIPLQLSYNVSYLAGDIQSFDIISFSNLGSCFKLFHFEIYVSF